MLRYLYKYRPINEETLDSIRNTYLYFSTVDKFNDPFDCLIKMKYEGGNDDWRKFLEKQGLGHLNSRERKEKIDAIKSIKPYVYETKVNVFKGFRLCCLTGSANEILMWSHYAKNHTGICIEYSIKKYENDHAFIEVDVASIVNVRDGIDRGYLLPAGKVNYSDVLPKPYNRLIDAKNTSIDFVYTKYTPWNYENEYRIFIEAKDLISDEKVKVKSGVINRIIFGLLASESDIEKVKSACVASGQTIRMSRVTYSGDNYKINILDI